ncbi:MAG: tRNA (adenosine(37)-N6)-threonylcarbamoyltransferase complex dimerization subunit type 1 TsaB [Acholeplasma sp.]|nr:tRNA (adenosine(37)-N6)-threonylcarbamoyltransferase complex dimerization subunit type 1 TsaB [Acholeplasma sp.]
MKELIIDTATNLLYVGLISGNKKNEIKRIGKSDNAAYLVQVIADCLKSENLELEDLDNIIVGVGPGSYTGLRVAVTVAKMLAYTKGINLKGISSLNLLSSGYEKRVVAAIDARRNHCFAGIYENGVNLIKDHYLSYDEITNKDELVILNEETIKINLDIVSTNAYCINDVHKLEPNYLRKTEAENEYDKKNDLK